MKVLNCFGPQFQNCSLPARRPYPHVSIRIQSCNSLSGHVKLLLHFQGTQTFSFSPWINPNFPHSGVPCLGCRFKSVFFKGSSCFKVLSLYLQLPMWSIRREQLELSGTREDCLFSHSLVRSAAYLWILFSYLIILLIKSIFSQDLWWKLVFHWVGVCSL